MREFYWRPFRHGTPWSLFWGWFTRYAWGWQAGSRWTGWLVWSRGDCDGALYWSPDGTPGHPWARRICDLPPYRRAEGKSALKGGGSDGR